jgi:acyl dehydratase
MGFGRYFEEFEPGAVYRHWPGKTVTEYDHHLFCLLTLHHHPLHLDAHYAESATRLKQNLVVSSYLFSLLLGLSTQDVAGRALTHLAFGPMEHLAPVFHGDTVYGESTVLEKQDIEGRPDRGLVRVETRGHKQDGTLCYRFQRKVVIQRQDPTPDQAPDPGPGR